MKTILMNKDMTKAILEGRKTQTRRLAITKSREIINENYLNSIAKTNLDITRFGKYEVGDILWVRELEDCLKGDDIITEKQPFEENRVVIKTIEVNKYSPEYKEYQIAKDELEEAHKALKKKELELAKSLDDVLYKISCFEVNHHDFWVSMKFTIATQKLKK